MAYTCIKYVSCRIYLCNMKRIITSLLLGIVLCFTESAAQNSPNRFYTVGETKSKVASSNNKEYASSNELQEKSDTHEMPIQTDTEKTNTSIDSLKNLIGEYERYVLLKDSMQLHKATGNKGNVHSYYKWKPRDLTLNNLADVLTEVGLSNKLFVLAQALLETGHFSSRVCKEYNNLFGLYDSKNRDYYRFARWEDSVVGYRRMIQYRYNGGNYLHFLKRIGYAEDPQYITKVAKVAKSLYGNMFSK